MVAQVKRLKMVIFLKKCFSVIIVYVCFFAQIKRGQLVKVGVKAISAFQCHPQHFTFFESDFTFHGGRKIIGQFCRFSFSSRINQTIINVFLQPLKLLVVFVSFQKPLGCCAVFPELEKCNPRTGLQVKIIDALFSRFSRIINQFRPLLLLKKLVRC